MRALDTNVLVRFLVKDDTSQAEKVFHLFQAAEKLGERFQVTIPVLLELLWVLSSVYDCSREDILHTLDQLTSMSVLEFQSFDLVKKLVSSGKTSRLDLSDILIGLCAQAEGCESTLTFEKKLHASPLFSRL